MEIGALSRPMGGESQNGDGYLMVAMNADPGSDHKVVSSLEVKFPMNPIQTLDTRDWDLVLVAVLDGVGHGPEAAGIAEKLIDCLSSNCRKDLDELVRLCHRSVKHTRGAAMGAARIDVPGSRIEFIGVGNVRMQVGQLGCVAGQAGRKTYEFVSNKGIIGYNLPARLATFTHEYFPDDALAMFTDGIDEKFALGALTARQNEPPSELIKAVFTSFGKKSDDATLVLAR